MLAFTYIGVVLIWATTPLAIQWSSHGISISGAAAFRMTIAVFLAVVVKFIFFSSSKNFFRHWKIFFAASLGVFPNMPLVYWSAQFIPSGIIAVVFALSPLAAGLMSWWLLKQNPFNSRRLFALLTAVTGLSFIFYQQWQLDWRSMLGVVGIVASSFLFSFSSALVKKLGQVTQPPSSLDQATGALVFALPGLWLFWWLQDGQLPQALPPATTVGAILYLALVGSLLGAMMFFYVLQRMSPSAVSLITLMTPVLALGLGNWLAGESLRLNEYLGILLVLLGLVIYSFPIKAIFSFRAFSRGYKFSKESGLS